ncbi:MAG TPA: exodeoxyribonuclease V subunit gamma, partial [Acidimicrobiales bacterium]|nr:exodeoxyribonuclease V subunit gamma [Acidimicrobiales bacterium]
MLHLHRAERADLLVAALGELLLDPPDDPLVPEVVAVPTRGVERWLTQRLSHRLGAAAGRADGVCANVEYPFPGVLVARATAVACGFDPDQDPWPPERSVWPLMDIVDAHLDDRFLAPLAAHLRASSPRPANGAEGASRRFATVRHLADLYDRYAVHRPGMVQAWAQRAGSGADADEWQEEWQAELWRRLRDHIGVPSRAERLAAASARLADEPELLGLPDRISLFGLTRLPASQLQVLEAIASHRDVHLFLLHPSGALWDRVARENPRPAPDLMRRDDPTRGAPANPLLRSWGRDAREMQLVLAAHGVSGGDHLPVASVDASAPESLLGLIQADIRADRVPGAGGRPPFDAGDDSLRVHACHGRARQVEVVRDAILHLLATDPTLEPRDVIVMCPDIEAFAPLVHSAFAGAEEDPGSGAPAVRVRLADRSLRQTNPLLAVAAALLDLTGERVTASQVLDLAAREPVSRRFRFDEEELAQLERWVSGTGIRWGLDGAHRRPWSLDAVECNTWGSGLDRLLLGVTMAEDGQRLFADALPYDDVSSPAVDLVGRFAEMVERLQTTLDELGGTQSVDAWRRALVAGTERLAMPAPEDGWQQEQLHRVLAETAEEAAGSPTSLDRGEVRALLAERLRGRPTRANFRTGDLTICTLVPMRSVPHRVVCLLGLDDGVFPRHAAPDGDDLLLDEPRVGDRDGPGEDRQLLLDAVLAATEHLVITYEGRDLRTNRERPPAVPVAELLDVVDRTVQVPGSDGREGDRDLRPRDAVVIHHPLQSFDARNFTPGVLTGAGPWSF